MLILSLLWPYNNLKKGFLWILWVDLCSFTLVIIRAWVITGMKLVVQFIPVVLHRVEVEVLYP